ncbi:rna-directed dna polymerase from mobile element jockey- hypothetical protein [Limosa lapponica baueri]|uniref:Reverse transcriptase domain-containing protein n=1 Tax=Limosa lapponica baueri TaxID=1758121 RepID=A0A2I0U632_LIMLA|nr:rna-directed dna polymerase from mobile element jockey- hypothetical protein [Limosa lapponica baueri]
MYLAQPEGLLALYYQGNQWKPVLSSVSQGSILAPMLLNIFISDIDNGLSKSADDTKLSGAVDTLEERDTIQRDLHMLEIWAPVNLMKFNQAKCKVLHLAWDNPQYQSTRG